ncbi:MAG TPA: M42 family metallopeptidase [Thermotogota bacterium]|nr:M42 family metallopeptidase [Thermotogota bacterium]
MQTKTNLEAKEMLFALSQAFGPPGREKAIRELVRGFVSGLCDQIEEDASGNLVAVKKGYSTEKVMFSSHMDEVSLLVSRVHPEGYLRIHGIGVDPKILPSQRVHIHTRSGEVLRGVVGMLAPHLQTAESRKKVATFDDLFVDVSMADFSSVSVGDFITFDSEPFEMENVWVGKTFDDRACCVASILALQKLQHVEHPATVYAVFSSREEIGAMGAKTAAHWIQPDVAIALDATHGNDFSPGYEKIEVGKGPAIGFGPVLSPDIFAQLQSVASQNNIPYQFEACPGRTGTDADQIQLEGIRCGLISVPLRYMHTPFEMIQEKDLKEAARLLSSWVSQYRKER